MIYLDNAATTQVHSEVIDLVVKYMASQFGNPASLHHMGLESEKALKNARGLIAKHLNCQPDQIVFTSGGSESNNWVIQRLMESEQGHAIVSGVEHPSVLEAVKAMQGKGFSVTTIPVNQLGTVSTENIVKSITPHTKLVSIMLVNNELGTIQPIENIVRELRNSGYQGFIHTDATQAAGKIRLNLKHLDVDFLSLSAHKCHGPKGVGLLYMKRPQTIKPLIFGGGQESNQRSGTHNLPGIVGMAKAIAIADTHIQENWAHVSALRAHVIEKLRENPDIAFFSGPVSSTCDQSPFGGNTDWAVPHILSIGIKYAKSEVVLHALEAKGIMVSSGSACSSNKKKQISHVIEALGVDKTYAEGIIRMSFSSKNTLNEVDTAAQSLLDVLNTLHFPR